MKYGVFKQGVNEPFYVFNDLYLADNAASWLSDKNGMIYEVREVEE